MNWYEFATAKEVYNVLNTLGMEMESFHYVKTVEYGDAIRQYHFTGETFCKAEQVWAEREELV